MKGPPHFEILSQADQDTYNRISAAISAPTNRNKRNKRADDFREILEALILYENHDEVDKWKRCLVCGLYPFEGGIAVNISTLKKLIFKCKSSINGSLKAIGYPNVTNKSSSCEELLNGIPYLRGNQAELRQWTVRYKGAIPDSMSKDTFDSSVQYSAFVTPPSPSISDESKYSLMTLSVSEQSSKFSAPENEFDDMFYNFDFI